MGDVRVNQADRRQPAFEMVDIERLVPEEHRVRDVWAFAETLDLSVFYARIKARGETVGRPAVDPRIVLALWLYATIERVGSARALDRLCGHHLMYRWICAGWGSITNCGGAFATRAARSSTGF